MKNTFNDKINNFIKQKRLYFASRTTSWIGFVSLLLIATTIIVDMKIILPPSIRWSVLAILSIIAVISFIIYFYKPFQKLHEHEAIEEIENENPELGQKLRTSVEMADLKNAQEKGISTLMVQALVEQTNAEMEKLSIQKMIPWKLVISYSCLALLIFIAILSFTMRSEDFSRGLRRVTNPNKTLAYTDIELVNWTQSYRPGDTITIEAKVAGRDFGTVLLHIRNEGEQWEVMDIPVSDEDKNIYTSKLTSRERTLYFYITAGDGKSAEKMVKLIAKPKLARISGSLHYPSYTKIGRKQLSYGDINGLEGSDVIWDFEFNKSLKDVALWVKKVGVDAEDSEAIKVETTQKINHIYAKRNLKLGNYCYYLKGHDNDGQEFITPTYQLIGEKDEVPAVELEFPVNDIEVTTLDEIPVEVKVNDDFGLKKVVIAMKVGSMDEPVIIAEKTNFVAGDNRVIVNAKAMLERYPLEITSSIRLYAYAVDNKPNRELRNRGISKLCFIDIRPFRYQWKLKEPPPPKDAPPPPKKEDLIKLNEAIRKQKELFSTTFRANEGIELKYDEIEKLGDDEFELSEKVLQLGEEMEKKGVSEEIVNFIMRGSEQMAEATAFLDPVDTEFSKAFAFEDRALSSLIAARKDMVKKMMKKKKDKKKKKSKPKKKKKSPDQMTPSDLAKIILRIAKEEEKVRTQLQQFLRRDDVELSKEMELPITAHDLCVADISGVVEMLPSHSGGTELVLKRTVEIESLMFNKIRPLLASYKIEDSIFLLSESHDKLLALVEHLKGLDANNLAETIKKAANMSSDSAKKLSDKGSAGKASDAQRQQISAKNETIKDWLAKLAKSQFEDESIQKNLEQLSKEAKNINATQKIKEANQQRKNGNEDKANKLDVETAKKLASLANNLNFEYRMLTNSSLANVADAQKLLEKIQKAMKDGKGKGGKGKGGKEADMKKMLEELAKLLPNLKDDELKKLATEIKKLTATSGMGGSDSNQPNTTKEKTLDPAIIAQVRARLKLLSEKLVANSSERENDAKVPARYNPLVERYFKMLSDDLDDE